MLAAMLGGVAVTVLMWMTLASEDFYIGLLGATPVVVFIFYVFVRRCVGIKRIHSKGSEKSGGGYFLFSGGGDGDE